MVSHSMLSVSCVVRIDSKLLLFSYSCVYLFSDMCINGAGMVVVLFFFKQKTAYEI